MHALTNSILDLARALPVDATVTVPVSWVLSLSDGLTDTPEVGTLRSDPPPPTGAQLITVKEASDRLGLAVSWIYRQRASLPFTVRVGSRSLRVDVSKLERWIARSASR